MIQAALSFAIVMWGFPPCPALAKERPASVSINNSLGECVRLSAGESRVEKNLLLLPARLEVIKSLGVCGCKSGAIRYRTYETYQERTREMNRGLLNSIARSEKAEDVILVLNSDTAIRRRPPFAVDLACGD